MEDIVVDEVVEKGEVAVVEKIEDSEDEEGAKGQHNPEGQFDNANRFNYEPLIAKALPEVGVNRAQVQVPESMERLGESVYKLNKYLSLKKDIKSLQKENCVRDDIKKKLDLKERWLSTPSPVESLSNKFTFNTRTLSRDSIASGFSNRSAESSLPLFENAIEALKKEEDGKKLEESFDKIVIGNQSGPGREKPFLQRSDSLEDLLREKALKQQKLMQPLKNLESKNFANTMDFVKSQIAAPKIKAQDSCDLSKYFPDKKVDKKPDGDVNKTQKPLKDVDLAQYFSTNAPQECLEGNKPPPRPNLPKLKVEERKPPEQTLNENDFNMFDQLMDGAIDLKVFMKHIQGEQTDWNTPQKSNCLQVNYDVVKSPSQEYKQFFGNMEDDEDDISITLDDLIDEHHALSDFESILSNSVASPVVPVLPTITDPKSSPPEKPIRVSILTKGKKVEDVKKKAKQSPQKPKRIKSFSKPVDPNRGIDSSLVPPKPRTIRNIPGMILNSMKGKTPKMSEKKSTAVKQDVSDANKSGAKPKQNKKITCATPKGAVKAELDVSQAKEGQEKVTITEVHKLEYVSDPKMAKYFFDDVSILGDLDGQREPVQTAGHEIFDDALETSSTKRFSDIERIFERINSEESVIDKVCTPEEPPKSAEEVNMVDNTIFVPVTPQKELSLDKIVEESKPSSNTLVEDTSPETVAVVEASLKKLESNSSAESNKSSSRREILMKMHVQTPVNEIYGLSENGPSLPPTPTPRRRSKSKSTEPTSPIPPRRMKKTSISGSVESKKGLEGDKVNSSPLVLREEVDLKSSRKYSEPEKRFSGKYDNESALPTLSPTKRRSGDYTDYTSPNYHYRDPIPTTTSYLLNKSKNLHDRKREFMNERVSGNNPYMRRMLSREEREEKISAARSALDESRTLYSPTTRTNYSGRMSPLGSSSYYTPSSRLNYNTAPSTFTSSYAPSTHSSHTFMDYFRRAPHSPPPSSRRDARNARDGCIIS